VDHLSFQQQEIFPSRRFLARAQPSLYRTVKADGHQAVPLQPAAPGAVSMSRHLSERVRQEIFAALMETQDQDMPVVESRHEISKRYGISDEDLCEIEREGLENDWLPFEK
jgi:hypothetical protein